MIRTLSIKNYAIINELEIKFSNNLSIITGETGAGKSIILGALGLIMGKRADSKTLYLENEKCIVEAVFDIKAYSLHSFFEKNNLDYEVETCIRREITPTGKSRAFVNDTPVLLSTLKELSNNLIDLHQQFDTLTIHDTHFQTNVIDTIANNNKLLEEYQLLYNIYKNKKEELNRLNEKKINANKESDFLNFQLNELTITGIKTGEIEALETELKILTNAEEIQQTLGNSALQINENENAICTQITELYNAISKVVDYHPDLPELLEKFNSTLLELEEIGNKFHQLAESTEHDNSRLTKINERLSLLYGLLHKYHVQTDKQLSEIKKDLEYRLSDFKDLSNIITDLELNIHQLEQQLLNLGQELSSNRQKVTHRIQKSVHKLLSKLSMQHAILKVEVMQNHTLMSTGIDKIRFLFAANKGSKLEEIKNIASGGELSRLALCIKSLVASTIPLPTLIFDEIDTGISGVVAHQMGIILQELSTSHQVISITHSAQIAAKAKTHYFVTKITDGNKTTTKISELTPEDRIIEIAKMLSGSPPSEIAKENARELLGP